ncbi:acetyl-CoA carboxylase biotin carboxylase subunit [Fictibacillus phosphorivorans]|uniref:acetyl-CoA carboxylase biotin carboxylase subunit n=1 Tax=Fictibacillus phosphorivorans TaxID=1221500 RepID=UPI002041DE1D|nr:acetyl-CoA carboxylase biotin carboxylase subunit [Fictibacillus phosphorivorans]MCM3717268.1 acetyl-CoA carboxylase biotin carboxylase subunit [Fictibacillus phosphorivorans]MCM3774955.1 acetyl-CoA carboxylase biotin carboxylase subunit [Fictibacillus phosphorivorans]
MKKILIANRGEIALRIIQTCKEMNIETVAVYSDADRDLPFVKAADEAIHIGESPVAKSYLQSDTILKIAIDQKVDAVHPGYGLLSENDEFAKKIEEAGITFIGPSPQTIEWMGDKIMARKTMQQAGVPIVPGTIEPIDDVEEGVKLAEQIGYPVMLKASSGGGGIGMVKCENKEDLHKHFVSSQQRAKNYFGSGRMFIEKCIENARHIEVQIMGDTLGNIVHLYERDCSIQRRNQKVVEESPSPFLTETLRSKITEAAVEAAKAVNYVNAGTVEFVVSENGDFYFLEMNTRLQVEHPVTESITGLDLVRWQIQIAQGEALPLTQTEIMSKGHAMEFRLYAEDPVTFFPAPGKIEELVWPDMDNVRIDTGYESGNQVTPFYDPMIAKIIVSDSNRSECLESAKRFFDSIQIKGLKTNALLFQQLLEEEGFIRGNYTTEFLSKRSVSRT